MLKIENINKYLSDINLACVIDHSGRAGNAFFLTIFDQHPEIIACPLMHYTYSYIITHFEKNNIPTNEAHKFLTEISYFRLLYALDNPENKTLTYRMGMDDSVIIQAEKIRNYTDAFFRSRDTITRKELAILPFIIYALAHNKDISQAKYVLISDAISLRSENVNTGYSGKVIDTIIEDFPKAKLINLVRDPRATFASPRHQFVNWLGNMYALKPGNFWARMKDLWTRNLTMDNTCVYLFWLLYLAQSARAVTRKKAQFKDNFISVRNEDLNKDFLATATMICDWLNTSIDQRWENKDFQPTILGKTWHGTGAYNNRYQTITNGRLQNEPDTISKRIAGPNTHVTQRWQKELNKREIRLLERLFKEELQFYNYPIIYDNQSDSDKKNYLLSALLPFEGELPTMRWLINGTRESIKEGINRFYYCATFIPFYLSSRVILYTYVFRRNFFKNIYEAK
ncbi:sulfotransferase [Candidatus Berkiella cookevillensis]|uniref:Sulfotransferase n=1 Tax=Candidatus Berkiella cookevillensis TaxID=437022 RepID=A0A0Q9YGL4_9GAMM|nr:sulfotransferase [Candidatus Berkiella cookevillensis]MCS5707677.1 sulfotransferase [Candidatus Berkiella cookevillensis]